MDNNKYFFAVDLGATSGRTIIGTLAEGKVQLEELTRFDNSLIETVTSIGTSSHYTTKSSRD